MNLFEVKMQKQHAIYASLPSPAVHCLVVWGPQGPWQSEALGTNPTGLVHNLFQAKGNYLAASKIEDGFNLQATRNTVGEKMFFRHFLKLQAHLFYSQQAFLGHITICHLSLQDETKENPWEDTGLLSIH